MFLCATVNMCSGVYQRFGLLEVPGSATGTRALNKIAHLACCYNSNLG
jgi:hypothetical protein